MTTVPGEIRLGESTARPASSLPTGAWLYFVGVSGAALAAAIPLTLGIDRRTDEWTAFLILSACAALAQLFVVRTTRDQSYHTSTAFLIAGALLLPPELVVLMGVVQHIPEWIKHRYAWYIQTFNICNFTLDGLAAWGVARLVLGRSPDWVSHGVASGLAGLAACVVFVALNHVLMAVMLYLARGHHPRDTELFGFAMLATELVLAAVGIGVAALWHLNPWLIPFSLAPLFLIHRSLHVPRLEEQARIDPKTGLFNARHFSAALAEELARAERFDRPAALIMADLDLLREINNTHGHLVGDAVLSGVADVFREELRDYDVPARFGGEEFALLLPETGRDQALEVAERIRAAVAARALDVEGVDEPLRVTISMGVASFPRDGTSPNELVHCADLAVYRAKLQGRNRVLGADLEGLLVQTERAPRLIEHTMAQSSREVARERRRRHMSVELERRRAGGVPAQGIRRLLASLPRRSRQSVRDPEELREAADRIHKLNASLAKANRLLRERSTETMESLSATVDARDAQAVGHSQRVRRLALAIGRQLDLSEVELDLLGHAALLHDIGKLAIPDEILLKPARLAAEEWRLMRRHADEGAKIVDHLGYLADAVPAIRHHHERYDGSGYPDGLAGDDIPLGARIIHVADAIDSMLTSRVYRPAMSEADALAELRAGAGTQFCPRCVHAVEQLLDVDGGADRAQLLAEG
jgi:diguanylate cyclase (GGDEF)-like protein/putative nucleotidyltransferase with HDIG domain